MATPPVAAPAPASARLPAHPGVRGGLGAPARSRPAAGPGRSGRPGRTGRGRRDDRAGAARCAPCSGRCWSCVLLVLVWLVGVPAYAWSQVGRVDDTPSGRRPGDQPGRDVPAGRVGLARGPLQGAAEEAGHRVPSGVSGPTRSCCSQALSGSRAGLAPPRLLRPSPGTARTRSTPRTPSAARTCWCRPSSRPPACGSTTTPRSASAASCSGRRRSAASDVHPGGDQGPQGRLDLKEGCQTLDGNTALGYVRLGQRARGDLDRIEHQRQFLSAGPRSSVARHPAQPVPLLEASARRPPQRGQDRPGHHPPRHRSRRGPGAAYGLGRRRAHASRCPWRTPASAHRWVPLCCGTRRRRGTCSKSHPRRGDTSKARQVREVALASKLEQARRDAAPCRTVPQAADQWSPRAPERVQKD